MLYLGLLKITFEPDTVSEDFFAKDAKDVCRSIEARFKVLAKTDSSAELGLAITTLQSTEHSIEQLFEKIMDHCEQKGLGRVEDQVMMISNINDL